MEQISGGRRPQVSTCPAVPGLHWRGILLLGAVARLLFAFIYLHFASYPPLLARNYEDISIAMSLDSGHGYSSPYFVDSGPTAFIAPGYPLFLALLIKLFGTGTLTLTLVIVIQELFSLVTVALVMFVARLHFGNETANLAGLICAVAPPMLAPPLFIWDSALSALIVTGMFAAAGFQSISSGKYIPAGIVCAGAGLTNPSLLPTLFALCGLAAWQRKTFPWFGMLAFCVAFSPWPIRNAVVMHAFIPLRTNFGYELWLGNHPLGNGSTDPALSPMTNASERRAFVSKGELRYIAERGSWAKAYIAAHPQEYAKLTLGRILQFWALAGDGETSAMVPIFTLAIPGMILICFRSRKQLFLYLLPLLIFPLPYYFTHTETRFRTAVDPILAILSAFAISQFLSFLQPKNAELMTH